MTPANATRLDKAGRELQALAQSTESAQSVALAILRTMELLNITLSDLIFRSEVNSGAGRR